MKYYTICYDYKLLGPFAPTGFIYVTLKFTVYTARGPLIELLLSQKEGKFLDICSPWLVSVLWAGASPERNRDIKKLSHMAHRPVLSYCPLT